MQSLVEPGLHSTSTSMFDTIWQLCSTHANVFGSSAYAQAEGVHFNGGRGASYNIIQHLAHSALFQLFTTGLEQHMGQDVRPNVGLDYKILHEILKNVEVEITDSSGSRSRKCFFLLFGFYLLGWDELTDLKHVVIPLIGLLDVGPYYKQQIREWISLPRFAKQMDINRKETRKMRQIKDV
eukprot:14757444-Ditylum_brightwellii.AAC.1